MLRNNLKLLLNPNNKIEFKNNNVNNNFNNLIIEKARHEGYYTAAVINGVKSIQLCSKYNPEQEAKRFVQTNYKQINDAERIFIYGFGLGYHILELAKYNKELIVIECNTAVFKDIISDIDFTELFSKKNVKFLISSNISDIKDIFESIGENTDLFLVHQPSLDIIPDDLQGLKITIKNYSIKINNIRNNSELLISNRNINLQRDELNFRSLKGIFQGRDVVLVSAGPSLINSLSQLKIMSNNVIICCVGRALKPLLDYGITPDVTMLVDPHDIVNAQFEGIDKVHTSKIKLFYSESSCPKVIDNYFGEKYLVDTVDSGGSVATTFFSALAELKVKSIALIGQDLAYSYNKTHIDSQALINKNNLLEVPGINNNTVLTSYSLNIFKLWFEDKANELKDSISLYNCTNEGAYIKGFLHISIDDYYTFINIK
ncbi:MAG: hypothetical protein K0S51_1520 [Bacillales bacterium]|nr:hypothetical protein [Bacillales bacterium]